MPHQGTAPTASDRAFVAPTATAASGLEATCKTARSCTSPRPRAKRSLKRSRASTAWPVGDRVCVLMNNSPELVELLLGTIQTSGVIVLLSPWSTLAALGTLGAQER